MQQVMIDGDQIRIGPRWVASYVFPQDSILLGRTPFTLYNITWDHFFSVCKRFQSQFAGVKYVFIDATWDPIRPDNEELLQRRSELERIFVGSKVVVLTLHCQHFYDNIPGIIYVPFFAMCRYPDLVSRPKSGRFGCLNRRPALHRIRLMYNAIEQKLLDPNKDSYSIRFTNLYTNNPYNWLGSGYEWMEEVLQTWPTEISTHPDGFPCDYGIAHPAWHTGIVIITETESGDKTIICEKTAKGILSRSCFSVYMADVGYRVLEDLGFQPRFFSSHAEYNNIEPLLDIFRSFETQSQAMDYREQHIQQIDHNFEWFGINHDDLTRKPWYSRYEPKLRDSLNNL